MFDGIYEHAADGSGRKGFPTMSEQGGTGGSGGFKAAGSWLLRNALRLLTAIVLGAAIGLGLFYGGRSLLGFSSTRQTVSVDTEADELSEMAAAIDELDQARVALERRVASLERENTAQQDALLSLLDREAELAEATETVSPVEPTPSPDVSDMTDQLGIILARLDVVEQLIAETGEVAPAAEEQAVLRAMVYVLRAKFSFQENDLGQAEEDLILLRTLVDTFSDDPEKDILLTRIDRVIDEMATSPQIAMEDVNIIWNLLVERTQRSSEGQTD